VPLYEYQCAKCKHRFECIRKFSDPPLKKCPECGGKVEQLLSRSSVQFKGTGWYVTDYARKGSGAASSKEGGGDGDSAGKAEAKSDKEAKADKEATSGRKEKTESKGKKKD
jgi:putative FmdB family regulatory protein